MAPEITKLWVSSEVVSDGAYAVAIGAGDDRSWPLDADRALSYAASCFARAMEAEHDSALFSALRGAGIPAKEVAALVMAELRPNRDDGEATKPLRFVPAIGMRGPFLTIEIDGVSIGQLTPEDLREHGANVLSAVAAVKLDAKLYDVMTDCIGVDDKTARAIVGSLPTHWPRSAVANDQEEK